MTRKLEKPAISDFCTFLLRNHNEREKFTKAMEKNPT